MPKVSKKRHLLGYLVLGILLTAILLYIVSDSILETILGAPRSSSDDLIPKHEEERIRQELIRLGLPASPQEAAEIEYYNNQDILKGRNEGERQ